MLFFHEDGAAEAMVAKRATPAALIKTILGRAQELQLCEPALGIYYN